MRRAYLLAVILFLSSVLPGQTKPAPKPATPAAEYPKQLSGSPLPSRQTVEMFLKRMFGHDPNAAWKIIDIRPSEVPDMAQIVVALGPQQRTASLYVTPDGQYAVVGEVVPFGADPFATNRARLAKEATGPAKGPADAVITIVEFSDLQCPACRAAEPTLQKLLAENPEVRFVFQHFPLTEIHPWAMQAASVSECVRRENSEAFWRFAASVYQAQPGITTENAAEKLTELATAAGVDGAKAAACAVAPEVAEGIERSRDFGESLGVSGTPTVFINGRKLGAFGSVPFDVLTALVRAEIEHMKAGGAKP